MTRWIEDTPAPSLDLRLVAPAVALWVGCLIGLTDPTAAWWASAAGVGAGLGCAAVHVRSLPGWLALFVFLAVGAGTAGLLHESRLTDPVRAAAETGEWSELAVTVNSYPVAMPDRFPTQDRSPAQGRVPPVDPKEPVPATRWRISADIEQARIDESLWTSAVDVTVFSSNPVWATVTPGQQVIVRGRLSVDDFGALPSVAVRADHPISVVGGSPWWHDWTRSLRTALQHRASELSPDPAGLLPGLVLGDTSGIDPRLDADAKATGLAHLLAVSGSHFVILCGAAVLVLRRAGPRVAAAGGGLMLLGLVLLVGPQPSVLRAAVMGGITVAALLIGRSRTVLPALATAIIALLLTDPGLALSAGFALSGLATAGLVLLAPAWSKALQRRGIPPGWAAAVAIPIAAQLVTAPVIAAISGSVSLVAVLANVLAAPVVAPALLIGVACMVIGPWWPAAAAVLAQLVEPLLAWVAGIAHTLARWPGSSLPVPADTLPILLLTGLLIAVLLLLRQHRWRVLLTAAGLGCVAVIVPLNVVSPWWPPTGWAMVACDVGQGDAIVLATGEPGVAVLVDAGPDPVLLDACLDRLVIATIPLVILSHAHADHIDGLAGVFDGRTVGAIATGPDRQPLIVASAREVSAAAAVPLVDLPAGSVWSSGALRLTVLAPAKSFRGTDSDPNNNSVVAMAELWGIRMLLTGDVQEEAQRSLLIRGADLRADVLKQPHHGSAKVLPAFVKAVDPQISVIGVGAENDYGHPDPRVLEWLTQGGVGAILRTDQDGDAAICVLDGELRTVIRGKDGTLRSR